MALFQCRRFQFFDLERVERDFSIKDNLKGYQIQCGTSGRGRIFLGDSEGYIHLISRQLDATTLTIAHVKGVMQMVQMKNSALLVTLGKDANDSYSLKFWDETVLEFELGKGQLILKKDHKLNQSVPPSCFAFHENLQLLAVGYSDGLLHLYRGEVTRGKTLKLRPLLTAGDHKQITGLNFKTTETSTILFASSENKVFSFDVTVRDREVKILQDNPGCALNCSCYTSGAAEDHFIVGRNDAVYCYTHENLGPCYAFSGEKYLLYFFRGYLLIISTSGIETYNMTVFDCTNKFIAFATTISLPEPISVTVAEWGYLFLITKDGSLWQLKEKDWQTKMNVFYKKNHFDLAITVAKSNNIDADGMSDIFRLYGDHLYAKGDLDGAIRQYCKTVGKLEASYVIRQYLDASRIANLLEYLEVVHKMNCATPDLTTLLLNCLTKLKLNDKIEHYVKDPSCYFLEPGTAINVFRRGGMHQQAYQLAIRHELYGSAMQILLEDMPAPSKEDLYLVLDKVVQSEQADAVLKRFANSLIRCLSEVDNQSADGWKKVVRLLSESVVKREIVELFISKQEILVPLLESILQDFETEDGPLMNLLLEAYLMQWSLNDKDDPNSAVNEKILALLSKAPNCPSWDWARALFACKTYNYFPGEIIAYEKKGLLNDLLTIRYAAAQKCPEMWSQFIETCRKYGRVKTILWKDAFYLITQSSDAGYNQSECPQPIVEEILDKLLDLGLLEPLPILTKLCQTNMKLGSIRSFLNKVMDRKDIEEDEKQAKKMLEEAASIRSQITKVKSKPSTFQGSNCNACRQKLGFPSVHFLCLHSFHQQCFENSSEDEQNCPICWAKNKTILEPEVGEKRRASRNAMDADFSVKLGASKSSAFSVVADFLAKGIFKREEAIKATSHKKGIEKLRTVETPKEEVISEARLRLQEGVRESPSQSYESNSPRAIPKSEILSQDDQRGFAARVDSRKPALSSSLPFPRVQSEKAKETPKLDQSLFGEKTSKPVQRQEVPATIRAAASSTAVASNPFEEDDSNPFSEDDNPAETSKNPFEEDDDYDPRLNPFAE